MKATWEMKKLGEICEKIKAGGTPSRKISKYWGGEIPFVKIEDLTSVKLYLENTQEKITQEGLENSNAWILPPNSVLFSIYASIGEVAINKIPVATNQAILGLIPKSEIVDPKFLAYSLKKFGKYLISYNIQSTQKNLTLEIVKNFEIPLPPLPIQQKIVKILDTIQEAIDIQEKIIEKTKELKKSLMAELFKYGAPSFRRGRKLKKTEIGEIPENWEVVRIKDVGSVITGTTPSTSVKEFWDGDIPFVTPSDFKNDSVYVYQTGRKVTSAGAQKGRIIPKNSILVVCIGSTLGKIALSYEECITNQQINAIICENFKVNPFFVYYFLLKNQGLLKAYAGTTTKPIVKKSLFETFLIPLPPLLEQREIAEILQTIDQKIEIEKRKKELYEELFKTMLNKIMNQEIDVEKIEV
jgi:type I restriction enzyme, S subunit